MMGHLSNVRRARWPAPSDSIDEEKAVSKYIPVVPTIVITPPPSPNISSGQQAHSHETSWPISEPNPFYLQPPPYLLPLHNDCRRESRHRSLVRGQHGWRTLIAVLILLIISSSLHGMYSIHLSEARTRDISTNGRARQEAGEGALTPNPVSGDSSVVSLRFELPQFFDWLT